ncbi:ATP-dependent DNA helicase [Sporosarcina sp. PTS2304]|uniref:ATP-dependent DNA helicase n=1 Tax=Sporosarcina sp. PTS2304 TaxID=2283194 RepID=UPI000E0DDEC7|nr:ATP-dependent DNA helicase [Sporosarcina sp. PTS2304]AXH98908.1 ATP-dependent DNA helicase [Sporosarcina sp. PTS2304]
MNTKIPFQLSKDQTFYESLNDWLGDTLYDDLTEKGFECRDEQIFMAFQIEQALKEKQVLLAEAGVGTGKTIAYLLPAIAYARYTGKPAVISCADETLIDQLIKEEGDIQKLSEALDLHVDVRLAKARNQYICLKRLEEVSSTTNEDFVDFVEDELPDFVYADRSLQSVYPYGVRSDYPYLKDEEWDMINYHPIQQCAACDIRNRCGQTIHRNHYRDAVDLIICSHDFYMEHLWTKESRSRQGQLPLLPEVSMVVFDEGHLLEYSAQRALTYEVQQHTIVELLERIMVDGIREKSLQLMEQLLDVHELFFNQLRSHATKHDNERLTIEKNEEMMRLAKKAVSLSHDLLEEFVFEGELYVIPEYDLKIVEEYLEQYIYSMELFAGENDAVDWLEERREESTLLIMPRLVTSILKEKLFTGTMPIVFSSATLSVEKSFDYLAYSLGIVDYQSFSIASPFDYENVMKIHLEQSSTEEKYRRLSSILVSEEQTLVLFNSKQSMMDAYDSLPLEQRVLVTYEGERSLSSLVKDFQQQKVSVFFSYHLWEGLDLPNESLTRVIIFDLPFPPHDPLFEARREFAEDAFDEVDLPFMLLRLRQGIGRLIRTSDDFGSIHLFVEPSDNELLPVIERVLPVPFS